jgi:uncharacterized protein (TIGR04206 family)
MCFGSSLGGSYMAASPRRRLAVVGLIGVAPWTVLLHGGGLTLVFPAGLVNSNPLQVVPITDFFFRYTDGLPSFIRSWGSGVVLYGFALVSAGMALVEREDRRITMLSLVGVALSQISVFAGFNRRLNYLALPTGTVLILAVVWWYYWPLLSGPNR